MLGGHSAECDSEFMKRDCRGNRTWRDGESHVLFTLTIWYRHQHTQLPAAAFCKVTPCQAGPALAVAIYSIDPGTRVDNDIKVI